MSNLPKQETKHMSNLTQNFENPNNQPLVIGDFSIRQDEDGRYCLNDLHKASGYDKKHQPAYFIRNQQTKDLIGEIVNSANLQSLENNQIEPVKKMEGVKGGTYVVKELVYSYAMWISAKFHLQVIRAYDSMVARLFTKNSKQVLIVDKTTKKDRVPLKDAVNMLVGKAKFLNYSDAYKLVHHRFDVEHIEDIPHDQIPAAVEYIHHLMGEYIPRAEYIDPELKALERLSAETTGKVMDYYGALHREIERLGGKAPNYPEFDKETIARAVVTRMVDTSRMLLTFDPRTGKPKMSFVPNNSWIMTDENIAKIIGDPCGPSKKHLPDIIRAAASRITA